MRKPKHSATFPPLIQSKALDAHSQREESPGEGAHAGRLETQPPQHGPLPARPPFATRTRRFVGGEKSPTETTLPLEGGRGNEGARPGRSGHRPGMKTRRNSFPWRFSAAIRAMAVRLGYEAPRTTHDENYQSMAVASLAKSAYRS